MKTFNRLSAFTLFIVLLLISLGGFVHNTDSSLACPDWPLCFGQVFPEMKGSVAIEHSHRLLATFVGLLTIGLVVFSAKFRETPQRPLHTRSLWALGLVIFQGVLGGVTVLLKISPLISTLHLATSQIFFALLAWLFWNSLDVHDKDSPEALNAGQIRSFKITALFLYIQMLLGASIRHGGAGVACGVGPEASLLCLDSATAQPTFWPTGLAAQAHTLHRYLAIFVAWRIFGAAWSTFKFSNKNFYTRWLKGLSLLSCVLVISQIALGIMTISTGIGLINVTLHLVFAALLWFVICSIIFLATKMTGRVSQYGSDNG